MNCGTSAETGYAMTLSPELSFTESEIDLLARTADALSAYMGKPVLAEIIDDADIGAECVLFAVPLAPGDEREDIVKVTIGGEDARFVGNRGGLSADDDDPMECEFLWGIQLSDLEGVRFIKLDGTGEEVAWTSDLRDILPFALIEDIVPEDDDDDDPDEDATKDDGAGQADPMDVQELTRRTLH
ncbi:hypothetical protein EV686_104153 [Paracandidimonas soli]|uniref:Uncharacterized protein n=2 Tax=Paracandidimonas soli TaxID=1917182 RepID=A0A4R3V9B7_9BURK|nr:hypothetical protein EV686_104153 [Paracandidimonas soli]